VEGIVSADVHDDLVQVELGQPSESEAQLHRLLAMTESFRIISDFTST
jgi:hypothetical protein